MDKNQIVPVTDTDTVSVDMDGLYMCLSNLNGSIENLSKSSVFNKAVAAERVLSDARDFMTQAAFIVGNNSEEILRLNIKFDLFNQNLKRINAVMGFAHGE